MLMEEVKFDANGLIPAIIQDSKTGEVLMMAYMNEYSMQKSLDTGKTHFWSRSRQKLWMKGETSGHIQEIIDMKLDCDGDTLLIRVNQHGPACHTGHRSCFYRKVQNTQGELLEAGAKAFDPEQAYSNKATILKDLYNVIVDRTVNPVEGSYTNYLFEKGIDKMLKKVGEESAEVIIAAKNRVDSEVIYEVADLFYHLLVVLVEQRITLDEIYDELQNRR
jgi:phosphoribosyl-ATP pyrophosphohydrolase/phosphoribosyl-AMP cyclohydrolase